MGELLHPVMPLNESINADTDDLNTILANSDKMAEINISNVDWDFTWLDFIVVREKHIVL